MIKKSTISEIKETIQSLSARQKSDLFDALQNEIAQYQFKRAVENIRAKIKKPVSLKEITKITERIRQKLYEERIQSRR